MQTDSLPTAIPGLTRFQGRLYDILRKEGPRPCKQLLTPVTGRVHGDDNVIAQLVWRMKPTLEQHGVTIQRTRRTGYALAALDRTAGGSAHGR